MTGDREPRRERVLQNLSRSIGQINGMHSADICEDELGKLKKNIEAGYNLIANDAIAGAIWNWGLDRDDLRSAVVNSEFLAAGSDTFSEQLYLLVWTAIPADLSGKTILEVGCGLGGGLSFLAQKNAGTRYVGLDLSARSISIARTNAINGGDLTFVQGDAERLPFGENTFDAVINVESSHNYPNLGNFFSEVARVLRPGGYFSHADCFTSERYGTFSQCKPRKLGLEWLCETDISSWVKAAISQRMQPDSAFQERCRTMFGGSKFSQILDKVTFMRSFGADFVGHAFEPAEELVRKNSLHEINKFLNPQRGYIHHLIRKTP
jgi:ubiquinone/menaquinone biosynthesis C-methylase UbiE